MTNRLMKVAKKRPTKLIGKTARISLLSCLFFDHNLISADLNLQNCHHGNFLEVKDNKD